MLTGHIKLDKQVNTVCIMQIFAYTCWLLCDFIDLCQDIRLDGGQIVSILTLFLWCDFLHEVSQERNFHITAELSG